jgi:hypothetical protein
MKHSEDRLTVTGSRDELTDHLQEMAAGWYHLAKDKQADSASKAAAELANGSRRAKAGHTTFVVDE